jgi:hypothetical protein
VNPFDRFEQARLIFPYLFSSCRASTPADNGIIRLVPTVDSFRCHFTDLQALLLIAFSFAEQAVSEHPCISPPGNVLTNALALLLLDCLCYHPPVYPAIVLYQDMAETSPDPGRKQTGLYLEATGFMRNPDPRIRG